MEMLKCKACGAFSVLPMEVSSDEAEEQDEMLNEAEEAHFYVCQVCNDNWLSVKRTPMAGPCEITFVHQMGMQPILKRIANMSNPVVVSEATVDHWSYFLGDEEVPEGDWRDRLEERRRVLKSICTN